jgi:hypothetical protein
MSEETALKILGRTLGLTVLASSAPLSETVTGDQGQSLFAYLVAQGLMGKAGKDQTGSIRSTDLTAYVRAEMPRLSQKAFSHARFPVVSISGQAFPVGKVR